MSLMAITVLVLLFTDSRQTADDTAFVQFSNQPRDTCNLPPALSVSINTSAAILNLNLEKNVDVDENVPVYIPRKNRNGTTEFVIDTLLDTEARAEYQDLNYLASVEVTCFMDTLGKILLQMRGMVAFPDGKMYEVDPDHRRCQTNNGSCYRLSLAELSLDNVDFGIDGDDMYLSRERTTGNRNGDKHHHQHRRKRENEPIYIDIVTLINYSVFLRWFSRSNQTTDSLKQTEAKQNLKRHFSHMFNAINLRYKTASPRYNIRLVGYIIEDQQHGEWQENVTTPGDHENETVNGDLIIASLRTYVQNTAVPENDHLMAFTAYDLYNIKDGEPSFSLAGKAFLGTVCVSPDPSVSVVEYSEKLVDDAAVASHELGHALNAVHDGEGNTCLASDQFIMSAIYSSFHSLNNNNPYHFSNCSAKYFSDFIEGLLLGGLSYSETCLLQPLNPVSVTDVSGEMPGQLYDPETQCRMAFGKDSYFCRTVTSLVTIDIICKRMSCFDPEVGGCFTVPAARGTSCGNKKWCISGNCTYSEDAPEGNEQCLFGNQPGFIRDNITCDESITPGVKYLCYHPVNFRQCCSTCLNLGSNDTGCEYGDNRFEEFFCTTDQCLERNGTNYVYDCCDTCREFRTTALPTTSTMATTTDECQDVPAGLNNLGRSCSEIVSADSSVCYNTSIENSCCTSCRLKSTKRVDCEYGDKYPSICAGRTGVFCCGYADICCHTCELAALCSSGRRLTETHRITSVLALLSLCFHIYCII